MNWDGGSRLSAMWLGSGESPDRFYEEYERVLRTIPRILAEK